MPCTRPIKPSSDGPSPVTEDTGPQAWHSRQPLPANTRAPSLFHAAASCIGTINTKHAPATAAARPAQPTPIRHEQSHAAFFEPPAAPCRRLNLHNAHTEATTNSRQAPPSGYPQPYTAGSPNSKPEATLHTAADQQRTHTPRLPANLNTQHSPAAISTAHPHQPGTQPHGSSHDPARTPQPKANSPASAACAHRATPARRTIPTTQQLPAINSKKQGTSHGAAGIHQKPLPTPPHTEQAATATSTFQPSRSRRTSRKTDLHSGGIACTKAANSPIQTHPAKNRDWNTYGTSGGTSTPGSHRAAHTGIHEASPAKAARHSHRNDHRSHANASADNTGDGSGRGTGTPGRDTSSDKGSTDGDFIPPPPFRNRTP
ncbi:hypothetical protein AC781_07040 [Akkermansia glycaniphila]|nr:hypothetical protein AC781_07040 [Akkermansia glycaniphila]